MTDSLYRVPYSFTTVNTSPTILWLNTPNQIKIKKMCTVNCRLRNYLIRARMNRDWHSYTITMLQSLQVLNNLISVQPWPQVSEKIEKLNQAPRTVIRRILDLQSTIENGCQWCRLHNLPNIAWISRKNIQPRINQY